MPARYVVISRDEMIDYLEMVGYEIIPYSAHEIVMEKHIRHYVFKCGGFRTAVRVFTSIVGSESRKKGKDAIRVVGYILPGEHMLNGFGTVEGYPKLHAEYPVSKMKRVHRVENWKKNLDARLQKAEDIEIRKSPRGWPMIIRKGKRGQFWTTMGYPAEVYTEPYDD